MWHATCGCDCHTVDSWMLMYYITVLIPWVSSTAGEFHGVGKRGEASVQLARILQYLECPQYLRKTFFPQHKDLQYAGKVHTVCQPGKLHTVCQPGVYNRHCGKVHSVSAWGL